jgi:enamine deaminase RidA (YjgF/YER057c/UK114 family)
MSASISMYNPEAIWQPRGAYTHIADVRGAERTVYIAGIVAANRDGETIGENDIVAQADLVFANLGECLRAAGLGWSNIVQFTTFLCRSEDVATFGKWRREHFPALFGDRPYPPNTLLIVDRLADPKVLLEVQSIAAQ